MGKRTDNGSWKKFKRSFSHLSLSGRSASDLTRMNVREDRHSQDSRTENSSEFESDRESTPLFSSTSTVDLHLNFQAWSMSRPASMAILGRRHTHDHEVDTEREHNFEHDERDHDQDAGPPPRSQKREDSIALPPRKHPYPSSLAANFKTYQKVASPLSLRKFFFGHFPRKRRAVFPRRVAGSSLASANSARGFKGISTKIRRAFTVSAMKFKRGRAPRMADSDASSSDSDESGSDSSSLEVLSDEGDDTFYSRVVKAAEDMNFDESTVGSLIMIIGEDSEPSLAAQAV